MLTIWQATPKDLPTLLYLAQETFREKWIPIDGKELVEAYIQQNMQISHFQNALLNPDISFWIAFWEEKPCGYLKIIRNAIPDKYIHLGKNFLQIEKLYLFAFAHRLKIGSELMKIALQVAQNENFDVLWLGVWSKNEQAIRFYEKFGFQKIGDWIFIMGDKICEDEWIMAKVLPRLQ
ncbi:GNAT family N-acetyltransferase [Raineya orbicola]|uniref:Acetyltransferase (GNAT) family n=1 Tax=Raineya orbicola TaxID=2016530 RepID=A0A2N3IIG4_9BACT|nr:GNAT family N-acetyltransferase [Raineya orbicola]PKQ70086.1 Acetyltransferase (GNAT) family [Raineya orbicola]